MLDADAGIMIAHTLLPSSELVIRFNRHHLKPMRSFIGVRTSYSSRGGGSCQDAALLSRNTSQLQQLHPARRIGSAAGSLAVALRASERRQQTNASPYS